MNDWRSSCESRTKPSFASRFLHAVTVDVDAFVPASLRDGDSNLLTRSRMTVATGVVLFVLATFFAAVMYCISLSCLAYRLAQRGYRPRLRFSLRSGLIVTALTAVLLALRPFGLFTLCVFAFSGPPFLVLCQMFGSQFDYARSHAARMELRRAMRTAHRMSR